MTDNRKARRPKTPPGVTPVWKTRSSSWAYRVRYRDPRGRARSKTLATLEAAKRFAATNGADVLRGDYLDPTNGRRTFGAYADDWLAALPPPPDMAASTVERYRVALGTLHELELEPVTAIDRARIRVVLAELRRAGYSRSAVHNARTVLSGVLGFAADDGAVRANAALGVKIGKAPEVEAAFLTPAQVERLAAAIENPPISKHAPTKYRRSYPEWALAVRFAAYTGVRSGELWALRVRNLDLVRRRLHVVEQVDARGRTSAPKYGRLRKNLALGPVELVRDLEAFVAGREAPDELVFPAPAGGPVNHGHWYTDHFAPAVTRAGLDGVVFHSLRHTCAAILADAGLGELEVMRHLGHRAPVATYRHLFPADVDRVAAALERGYARRGDDLEADVLELEPERRRRRSS